MKLPPSDDSPKPMDTSPSSFSISSVNQGFAARQRDLFQQLDVAERNSQSLIANLNENNERVMDTTENEDEEESECDRIGGSSRRRGGAGATRGDVFKKPHRPPLAAAAFKMPDHRRHPERWTKYSLADVSDDDMSERSNTAAAMSFLREIDLRKKQDEEGQQSNVLPEKIVFKKRRNDGSKAGTSSVSVSMADTVTFRSSKVVMPEYVVGQKVHKPKKQSECRQKACGKELKLNHLLDEDEEDQDQEEKEED